MTHTTPLRPVIGLLALFCTSTPAFAQTIDWELMATDSSNTPLSRSAAAYDSIRDRVVNFGGLFLFFRDNATLEWDGLAWSFRAPATVPPARVDHAMAFDAARSITVMFGGDLDSGLSNDTWEWNGLNWNQATPATSPPSRSDHAMVYDASRGVTVLFGGFDGSSYLNDTWEWGGLNWTLRTPATSPPAVARHAMAYDSDRNRTVLFGGFNGTASSDDTWEWNGVNWTLRAPATNPGDTSSHAMAYDPERQRVISFGGHNEHIFLSPVDTDETWEWDGSDWSLQAPLRSPPATSNHCLVFRDASDHVTVLGGRDGSWLYGPQLSLRVSLKRVLPPGGGSSNWTDAEIDDMVEDASLALARTAGLSIRATVTDITDPGGAIPWFTAVTTNFDEMEFEAKADPATFAWEPLAINVYLVDDLIGAGGKCSFPTCPAGVHHDLIALQESILHGTGVGLAHEIGHYLGLRHTHARFESQSCGCGGPLGDCVTDTRADANPGLCSPFNTACHYSNLQALGYSQAQEDLLRYNIMSYHAPTGAMEARLSTGQVARLMNHLTSYRWSKLIGHDPAGMLTAYGLGCAGTAGTPTLSAAAGSFPQLGTTYTLELAALAPTGLAFGMLGFNQVGALPLELIGMTGCYLHVNPAITTSLTNTGGQASWDVPLPSIPSAVGLQLYAQGFAEDHGANPFNATTTNGATFTIEP